MSAELQIDLDHKRLFCSLHGEPYRENWPRGFAIAAVELARTVLDANLDVAGDPRAVEALLDAKPACCRVGPARLRVVYETSAIGVNARCKCCRRVGLGTVYKTQERRYEHLCFVCVTENISATPWGAS